MTSTNIFVPIGEDAPPPNLLVRADHPVPRLGIVNRATPLQTNKFYANFFLGDRDNPTWTHPYTVSWAQGLLPSGSWGLSISHVDQNKLRFGQGDPPEYFTSPSVVEPLILSARELGDETTLTLDHLTAFSVEINLATAADRAPILTFHLVQGMGFVTAVYASATPLLETGFCGEVDKASSFSSLTYGGVIHENISRYSIEVDDGTTWLVYVVPSTNHVSPVLTLVNNSMILGEHAFSGIIQIAKYTKGSALHQYLYAASAGAYAVGGTISAHVVQNTASYTLSWTKNGMKNRPLLMFALPHHVQSFSEATAARKKTGLQLATTTKGMATAVIADSWIMIEKNLPYDMGFAPWHPLAGSRVNLPQDVIPLIDAVGAEELAGNVIWDQTLADSMYIAGKGLAKFASIVYALDVLCNNKGLASAGLEELKRTVAMFVNNMQGVEENRLVYDKSWGGITSSSGYPPGGIYDHPDIDMEDEDQGEERDTHSVIYDKHHSQYAYFVYVASILAAMDPTWLTDRNKAWVTMLIRDYANPSMTDPYFPFSRMFDWYHGHSWGCGLYESYQGKEIDSCAEDAFAAYALKMWGNVTGDANTEARGNLMLAVQARSFSSYCLMQADNTVQPASYIGNKAVGTASLPYYDPPFPCFPPSIPSCSLPVPIPLSPVNQCRIYLQLTPYATSQLFEYRVTQSTRFGGAPGFASCMHMVPLNPSLGLIRPALFVREEWDTYFSGGRADNGPGGWRDVVYANLALVDPKAAWRYFTRALEEGEGQGGASGDGWGDTRKREWLAASASRTLYLVWAAALGGAN